MYIPNCQKRENPWIPHPGLVKLVTYLRKSVNNLSDHLNFFVACKAQSQISMAIFKGGGRAVLFAYYSGNGGGQKCPFFRIF